ncbi:hypothetical protein gpAD87_07445 [Paenibacillus sp. AD87]|nr:hypothetical protein gpAD87_07445 [Paenibacillus sp. AD87]
MIRSFYIYPMKLSVQTGVMWKTGTMFGDTTSFIEYEAYNRCHEQYELI